MVFKMSVMLTNTPVPVCIYSYHLQRFYKYVKTDNHLIMSTVKWRVAMPDALHIEIHVIFIKN